MRAELFHILGGSIPEEWTEPAIDATTDEDKDTKHLSWRAREIVAMIDKQICLTRDEKEEAVAEQSWEKAVIIRDLEQSLKKMRGEFIRRWPRGP